MENVDRFIDQLIDEKGYTNIDDEVRAQLKADMTQRLMTQIDRAAIDALPEDKAIELADKMDDENFTDTQIADFMTNSGVDLQNVALETMLQFRLLYIGDVQTEAVDEEQGANENEQ